MDLLDLMDPVCCVGDSRPLCFQLNRPSIFSFSSVKVFLERSTGDVDLPPSPFGDGPLETDFWRRDHWRRGI